MSKFLKELWAIIQNIGETIGFVFIILGLLVLFTQIALVWAGLRTESGLLGASLGLLSVGLGFIAIGMAAKSDKRHTEILKRVDANVVYLMKEQDTIKAPPIGNVIVTPRPLELVIKTFAPEVIIEHKSKKSAQKRLDEDTKRVGYVRGELYQLEDGSWGISWGGKYPLWDVLPLKGKIKKGESKRGEAPSLIASPSSLKERGD